jgi:hypothetical protein
MAANLLILWADALLDLHEVTFLLVAASRLARLLVGFPTQNAFQTVLRSALS